MESKLIDGLPTCLQNKLNALEEKLNIFNVGYEITHEDLGFVIYIGEHTDFELRDFVKHNGFPNAHFVGNTMCFLAIGEPCEE